MTSANGRFGQAVAMVHAQQWEAAAALCAELVRDRPHDAEAWHLWGVVEHSHGRHETALAHLRQALALCDSRPIYWNNLGAVLKDLHSLAEADLAFRTAIQLNPDYANAWSNRGLIQMELGEFEQAEQSLRQALQRHPQHADALRHLARLARERGRVEEALRLVRESIAVAPNRADSHLLHGEILHASRAPEEALRAYETARSLAPQTAETYLALGNAHAELDRIEQARTAFRAAAALRPDRPLGRLRELSLCPAIFDSVEAIVAYRAELEQRLDEALAAPMRLDWRTILEDGFAPPFQLVHHGVCNRALFEKYAKLFAPAFPQHRPRPTRRGKLRVGFTCTCGHEGGFLRGFGGIMARLDRRAFEVVGLVSRTIVDACRRSVASDDIRWVGFTHHLERAWEAFREAECDIVLHWQAGTDTVNYLLPFLPLAPVQCIGFGSHGTTGIANLDHFVSSRFFERGADAAEDYTENLAAFDGLTSWQPYPIRGGGRSREAFGLPSTGSLYLCPHRTAKYHPSFDGLLREILAADPEGQVLLSAGGTRSSIEALQARFGKTLGPTLLRRIGFLPSQTPDRHADLVRLADAVLDVPTYSASLIAYDAFSCGTPLVTMPGKHMVERYATGLYRQMGLDDQGLVASSPEDYVKQAVRLGQDTDFRVQMRREIESRCHILFENDAVVREYERFFAHCIATTAFTG
jgi:predicted O-linked N-acetylglucosamine transferase (SPINDLY family)